MREQEVEREIMVGGSEKSWTELEVTWTKHMVYMHEILKEWTKTYIPFFKKLMSLFKILAVSVIRMQSEESTPSFNNLEALWMSLNIIQWVY